MATPSVGLVLRWTKACALIGLVLGVHLMINKVPPIAESGRKPEEILFYAFWVPVCGVAGTLLGLVLGTAAAGIAAVIRSAMRR